MNNWKIGKFEGQGAQDKPSMDKIQNFLKDNENVWNDFDIYLWGSFPNNPDTMDVDFLVHSPNGISSEQMEEITVNSLENSLVKNDFLADIGFTDEENMYNFDKMADNYKKTGEKTKTNGYIYADKWYKDDEIFRDRSKYIEGYLEPMDNNMYKKTSFIPYPKMMHNLKNDRNYYKNKPIKVSNKKGKY